MISKNCDVLATVNGVLKWDTCYWFENSKFYSSISVVYCLFIANGGECAEAAMK